MRRICVAVLLLAAGCGGPTSDAPNGAVPEKSAPAGSATPATVPALRARVRVDLAPLDKSELADQRKDIAVTAHAADRALVACFAALPPQTLDAWFVARVDAGGKVDQARAASDVPTPVAACAKGAIGRVSFAPGHAVALSFWVHVEPAPVGCSGDACVTIPGPPFVEGVAPPWTWASLPTDATPATPAPVPPRQPGGVPHVEQETTTVDGGLPPELITRVVRQNIGSFRDCYRAAFAKTPPVPVRIKVRFAISRRGAVTLAENERSSFSDHQLVACVVEAFGRLAFPESEMGETVVRYPLDLRPPDAAPEPPVIGPGALGGGERGYAGTIDGIPFARANAQDVVDKLTRSGWRAVGIEGIASDLPFVVFAVQPQDVRDALAPGGIVSSVRREALPAGSIDAGISVADGFVLVTEGAHRDELLASVPDAPPNPTAVGAGAARGH